MRLRASERETRGGPASPGKKHRRLRSRWLTALPLAVLLCGLLAAPSAGADGADSVGAGGGDVFPTLRGDLAAYYDFEHPVRGNAAQESDRGFSGTNIDLVNGGAAMRVRDGAHRSSERSLQTQQVDPVNAGNDDWKAGIYSATGVPTLNAFNAAKGITIMGWFKMTGPNPSPNTNTANPDDFYNAVGLASVLSGTSEGHLVRALLEVIEVSGELRVVVLGRRLDNGTSQTFAADEDWQTILPQDECGLPRGHVRLRHRHHGALQERSPAVRLLHAVR